MVKTKMVTFKQKMDSSGKIYIVKPLRQAGIVDTIEIVPNAKAAVIYQAGTKTKDVLASLQIIAADLKHRAKIEAEK
jgi:hypothetical protein